MDSENQSSPRPATDLPPNRSRNSRWIPLIHLLFILALLAILTPYEWDRVQSENQQLPWLTRFLLHVNVDTTPYLILLLLSPLCWFLRPPIHSQFFSNVIRPRLTAKWVREKQASKQRDHFACVLSILIAVSSFLMSVWTASHIVNEEHNIALGDIPPAYHDEYSYLFQANTFLGGQTSFPSHPAAPEIFDQVHVLNEGKLASRYFPGTGLWLAPFVSWGHPYWGYWLAGAITAFFIFWSGRELAGNGVGLLAGLIVALSPGMAIFSNLLLAHHPTLVGLSFFLWAFLRMQRTRSFRDAILAGLGLSFAMLCRPMTAAGFALPFGIWLAIEFVRYYVARKSEKTASGEPVISVFPLVAGLAIPLGCGLIGLFCYNQSITGSGWKMPYQLYTDIYTPRHVYGFNNVIRGEQKLGPKVLDNYDKWAKNLTPALAARNVQNRILASLQWTLGIIPLGLAGLIFLITEFKRWSRWWLVFASIISLHVAHIPYWYDGIMHWHYVFETGPLWALIFARVTQSLFRIWHNIDRPLMSWLWACLTLVAVLTNLTAIPPFWSVSKLEIVVNNVAFSKFKHYQFQQMIHQHPQIKQPALVLVKHDPADRHIDYIINAPQLDQAVLTGRDRPDLYPPAELQTIFPERNLYLFDAAQNRLSRWNGSFWEPI
ncbi:glycosyltransferase family 39 protein [uncultured Gimesia sp.]|uniref:ArnT family glycosyltransferase n=1 Tax=uncultured Gimesia sp. TaxID=1678688 RepID=UPI0030D77E43|tara:strand:- start:201508 stop:203484 length:1977 start_codon:yes stop_codon:yes gene_type:complete